MYEFMREMQSLAFDQLEPEASESINRRLEQLKQGDGDRIAKIASGLKLVLSRAGVEAEISGREKHPYSIFRKMSERHISFEQLSDVMAFRAIVPTEEDCYRALGIIHQRWPMVPGRFKDYISTPKRNGYRSLHTSVIHADSARIEIQIRTADMHAQAEFGLAAHWAYKQQITGNDRQVSWIRDLVEILDTAESPEELLEHTRMAMYTDRIFAFTPKGELIQLPKGATSIDFAYAVHTDLGDQAVGAKVNGRVVPLSTVIETGDQVQILRSKGQSPQPQWLNVATTGKALAAIRRHLRQKERVEQTALGQTLYDDIVTRLPAQIGADAGLGGCGRDACAGPAIQRDLDQGAHARRGVRPRDVLPSGAGRPYRRVAPTGCRDRGARDRLQGAGRTRRAIRERDRLGRRGVG
jgi:RelA/SpoT family (p)ppGpp synthetase